MGGPYPREGNIYGHCLGYKENFREKVRRRQVKVGWWRCKRGTFATKQQRSGDVEKRGRVEDLERKRRTFLGRQEY